MIDFYKEKVYYKWMSKFLAQESVMQMRRKVLANARGEVLEIGFGSGLNLVCYPESIQSLTAIDVDDPYLTPAQPGIRVRNLIMSAEAMLFPDAIFDTVVSTFTLCSIPDVQSALSEIRRVLKPGGKFLFLEHGKNPNPYIAILQNLANPFYQVLACGCHVNRNMLQLIADTGMSICSLEEIHTPDIFAGLYFTGTAIKPGVEC